MALAIKHLAEGTFSKTFIMPLPIFPVSFPPTSALADGDYKLPKTPHSSGEVDSLAFLFFLSLLCLIKVKTEIRPYIGWKTRAGWKEMCKVSADQAGESRPERAWRATLNSNVLHRKQLFVFSYFSLYIIY